MYRLIDNEKQTAFKLNYNEFAVMDIIQKLSIKQSTCTMSTNHIADNLCINRKTCQRIVTKLLASGMLVGEKATRKTAASLTVSEGWRSWVGVHVPHQNAHVPPIETKVSQGGTCTPRVGQNFPNSKNLIKELIKDNTMDIFFEDFFSFFFQKKEGIFGDQLMEEFSKQLFNDLKNMEDFKEKFPGAPLQLEEFAAAYFEKAPDAHKLEAMKQTPDPKEDMWAELQEMKRRTRELEARFMNLYPTSAGDILIPATEEEMNASSLFPEYANPVKLAPLSPPKEESESKLHSLKGKRTVASLAHNECMAMYAAWYESRLDVKPKIDVADGTALKHILKYLQESVQNKRQKKGDITPVEPEDVRNGFKFILCNWDERLADDKWLKSQITMKSMNCNLNKIVAAFNAAKTEPVKYASDGSVRETSEQRLSRKLAEYYATNPS